MAEPNTQQQNEDDAKQEETIRQRIALENAYGSLLGDQNTQTFAAFTFEDALDSQIETISGAGDEAHPNLLGRVARIKTQLLQAVEQISAIDPSQFRQLAQDDPNVNTPEDAEA
jgi:hypothetical protein